MSKIKCYRAPSRTLNLKVNLENAINEAKRYSNLTHEEMCKALSMSRSTLWSRLNDPWQFSLEELSVIALHSGKDLPVLLSEICVSRGKEVRR